MLCLMCCGYACVCAIRLPIFYQNGSFNRTYKQKPETVARNHSCSASQHFSRDSQIELLHTLMLRMRSRIETKWERAKVAYYILLFDCYLFRFLLIFVNSSIIFWAGPIWNIFISSLIPFFHSEPRVCVCLLFRRVFCLEFFSSSMILLFVDKHLRQLP